MCFSKGKCFFCETIESTNVSSLLPPPLSSPPPSSVLSSPLFSSRCSRLSLKFVQTVFTMCVNIFFKVHLALSQSLLPHSQMNILFYKYVSHFSSMYNIYKSLHLRHIPLPIYFCVELTIFSIYLNFPGLAFILYLYTNAARNSSFFEDL